MTIDAIAYQYGSRCLEARDRAGRELAQVSRSHGGVCSELHDRHDLLSETLARPAHHERVQDVRMAADGLFDLLDEDFLASAFVRVTSNT
jgi:hypothetical protein